MAQQATVRDASLIQSGDVFGTKFWSDEGWGEVRYHTLVVSGLLQTSIKGGCGENGGLYMPSSSSADILIQVFV